MIKYDCYVSWMVVGSCVMNYDGFVLIWLGFFRCRDIMMGISFFVSFDGLNILNFVMIFLVISDVGVMLKVGF